MSELTLIRTGQGIYQLRDENDSVVGCLRRDSPFTGIHQSNQFSGAVTVSHDKRRLDYWWWHLTKGSLHVRREDMPSNWKMKTNMSDTLAEMLRVYYGVPMSTDVSDLEWPEMRVGD